MSWGISHLWHDWLSVGPLYISERHLCALVLINFEFRVVKVRDLVNGGFFMSACTKAACGRHTSLLDHDPRNSHSRIGSHLDGSQTTTLVAFLTQFRGPVCNRPMSADNKNPYICATYLEADRPLYGISVIRSKHSTGCTLTQNATEQENVK